MVGVYLSGTGNTKHCIEKLTGLLESTAKTVPLESKNVVEEINSNSEIILGYPTQFSNAPSFMNLTFSRLIFTRLVQL